jgi:hypothetical protein
MPGERLSMRKIRELLRLRWEQQLPQRVIANSLRLSQASVSDYPAGPAARFTARRGVDTRRGPHSGSDIREWPRYPCGG